MQHIISISVTFARIYRCRETPEQKKREQKCTLSINIPVVIIKYENSREKALTNLHEIEFLKHTYNSHFLPHPHSHPGQTRATATARNPANQNRFSVAKVFFAAVHLFST